MQTPPARDRAPLDGAAAASPGAVTSALEAVRRAPTMVRALRLVDDLVEAAAHDLLGRSLPALVEAARAPGDDLTAIAAVHALGALPGGLGQPTLLALLGARADEAAHLREHAAWALGQGRPTDAALAPLVASVVAGGFGGMLAQGTLEAWSPLVPDAVRAALETALATTEDAGSRARLVETLGLVPGTGDRGAAARPGRRRRRADREPRGGRRGARGRPEGRRPRGGARAPDPRGRPRTARADG